MATRLGLLARHAAELLDRILAEERPADRQMDLFFRSHRTLGPRERGFVADAVYTCLRRRRTLVYRLRGRTDARSLVAAYLLTEGGISGRRLIEEAGFPESAAICEAVRSTTLADASPGERANLPDWFLEHLTPMLGASELMALAETLAQPAPLDIRVNTLKTTREQAQAALAAEGCVSDPTPYAPGGLRSRAHFSLFHSAPFRQGWIEVQDEASQLVALCLEPRRHECVVDFCAGAGGKTLHLGALMHNTGMLYAFDTVAQRLERAKVRIRRADLHNVRFQAITGERDQRVLRLHGKADRVLVDAPCSGSGTWRRNPDIKWRMTPETVTRLADTQLRIIGAAAPLLKPGGRMVYATCSLLPEENEQVVERFLAAQPHFEVEPVQEVLDRRHVPLAAEGPFLRLFPHRHKTDGFFVALLKKTG